MNPKWILLLVITSLQMLLTDSKIAKKVMPYILQVRDLCLLIAPVEDAPFSKARAMKKAA